MTESSVTTTTPVTTPGQQLAEIEGRAEYLTVSRATLSRTVYVLGALGISLGVLAILVSLDRLPAWFPYLALSMIGVTLAVVTWGAMKSRRQCSAITAALGCEAGK